jgi:DNA-binding transcriptional LysR family regulator
MDIARLEVFRNVARLGSLAAAARAASVDPSVVSRALAGLERELGVRLFQRTTRRLTLTEAGELYLARVDALVCELEAAREEVAGLVRGPRGRLRVTASNAFGQVVLAPLLPRFQALYPDVELELVLTDATLDLVAERIDVALRLGPRPEGDVVAAQLAPSAKHVVASPGYLERSPPIAAPADLAAHPCLAFPFEGFRSHWLFRAPDGQETAVGIGGGLTCGNAMVLRDLAIAGLGPTLVSDWLVRDDLAAGRLRRLLPEWTAAARSFDAAIWIVYPSRAFLPQKARVFIDHLREVFPRNGGSGPNCEARGSLGEVTPQ